jgi:hypothetical protein
MSTVGSDREKALNKRCKKLEGEHHCPYFMDEKAETGKDRLACPKPHKYRIGALTCAQLSQVYHLTSPHREGVPVHCR